MAGHSKWENIKRKKAKVDALRGKKFAILSKGITIAAREGGSLNPAENPRLRLAIIQAKKYNMPALNIDKAIAKAGNLKNSGTEIELEIYLKEGACIIVDIDCENKHEVLSLVNTVLNKYGVKIAARGSVSYMFDEWEVVAFQKSLSEDSVLEMALNLTADKYEIKNDKVLFFICPNEAKEVAGYMSNNFNDSDYEINREKIPKNLVDCSEENEQVNNLIIDRLNSIEGVVEISHNLKCAH